MRVTHNERQILHFASNLAWFLIVAMQTECAPLSSDQKYDVVVIGGGVNGTAALKELARAGYRVLLAEAEDFAAGASSRSSRMLHCGLRYLESAQPVRDAIAHPFRFARALGMARDAMEARAELAGDAGVATRAIELSFPVWRDGPFPRWQLDAGLRLLEKLGPAEPGLDRRSLSAAEVRNHPIGRHLRDQDGLRGMVSFREYLFAAPERICVENALDAEAHGADLRLRSRAELRGRDADGFWRVALEGEDGRTGTVRARVVLNMAGTWADEVGTFGRRLIRGTKGAHIVIRLPDGYADRGIATLHRGGHPFYGLPLREDRFYFGPTETLFEGDARGVHADRADVDFLLAEANHLLPGLDLKHRDVEQCWAGVRPLTEDPAQPMGARERRIHDLADTGFGNVLAMTAGPVMSHRSAGRRLLEEVRGRIGAPKAAAGAERPIAVSGQSDPETDMASREHAQDLFGVLVQRSGRVWSGLVSREDAMHTARTLAPGLGWTEDRVAQEVETFMTRQAREFHVPWHGENGPDHPGPTTGKNQ